ncbi:MAG: DUF4905 domain-containing protein [Ignavibacteriales bacterium]|nr:DUF4905 domain-containing protein [Ignavibacteriales bacterium]
MKLKKTFSFTDKNQIWRLLISETDKLIIETRDLEKKEVFFHCYDLAKGKSIFKNFQLEEKYWIGIEKIYQDKIIFHHFAKPDMPEHKKIIVYDILENKILWQNNDYTFLTILDDKVYAFRKKFEGRDVYILDFKTGETVAELGSNAKEVNEILQKLNNEDYSDYSYPENFTGFEDEKILATINKEVGNMENINNLEKLVYNDLLLFNYHIKTKNNSLDNVFAVYNIDKKKKLLSEIINKNITLFSPDSFFCYKNNLLLLKNKVELISYKLV